MSSSGFSSFTVRQLIDLAIGSPEPGHVNFYALQCLLYAFAEKMHIIDDEIDLASYKHPSKIIVGSKLEKLKKRAAYNIISYESNEQLVENDLYKSSSMFLTRISPEIYGRLMAGADPEDKNDQEQVVEEPTQHEEAEKSEDAGVPKVAEEKEEQPPVDSEVPVEKPEEMEAVPSAEAKQDTQEPAVEENITKDASALNVKSQDEINVESAPVEVSLPLEDTGKESADEITSMRGSSLRLSKLRKSGSQRKATIQERPSTFNLLQNGIEIMKDQLQLTMQEVYLLSYLILTGDLDPKYREVLRSLTDHLRSIQDDNTFIEGTHRSKGNFLVDVIVEELRQRFEIDAVEPEDVESEDSKGVQLPASSSHLSEVVEQERYDLDLHMCFSPEKLLDELLALKGEMCFLTNKVNELTAQVLGAETERMKILLNEMQEQMLEFRKFVAYAQDMLYQIEQRSIKNTDFVIKMAEVVEDLKSTKIDKAEALILLAEKVDYEHLQRKASVDQLKYLQCTTEKQFCQQQKMIRILESDLMMKIQEVSDNLGIHQINKILDEFKVKIEESIHALECKLQQYIDMTDDACAASGARIKVLPDLQCLSCGANCVMRSMEPSKVPKQRNAHKTTTINPLVTYELSTIRKSGIMGYYRKDEFPDSTNAWLKRQDTSVSVSKCIKRQAGGPHTTYTAKERIEKMRIPK